MKLLIDGHFLDGRKHGVAIFLDQLYTQYRKLQSEDELHIGLEPGGTLDYALFGMPRVYIHRYRFGGALRFLYDIPFLARHINADVIHTQYIAPLRFGFTAKRHITLHDVLYEDFPELFGPIYRWSRKVVFGWSARRAELITTVSEYSRSRIATLYGLRAVDIHLIYNGVVGDESNTSAPTLSRRENSILYVSRFEKRKNHLALLNSLRVLRKLHPGLRMVLVGFEVDGTLAKVRDYIVQHGLEDAVEIRSHISDTDLTNLYRTAGVVAYPSLGEGFGMPIIEAFLLNPNTLFSHTTAMAEFTFAPENTFDPADGTAITSKISKALCNRDTVPPEWQAQRCEVIRKYNWSRSAKLLVQIYHTGDTTQVLRPPSGAES